MLDAVELSSSIHTPSTFSFIQSSMFYINFTLQSSMFYINFTLHHFYTCYLHKRMGLCSVVGLIKFMVVVLILDPLVSINQAQAQAQLSYDYYETSCPDLENIVKKAILPLLLTDLTTPAALLRLMFHDCQVQGCDASILLDSDYQTIDSEMGSSKNFMLTKRKSIGVIKSILETECPGKVSCADIIVLAAKESVFFSGGPDIQIPLGRKDSTSASYKQADASLPSSQLTVDGMLQMFISKGMNVEESVSIMGAHTLGVGHCLNIVKRLYDPNRDYKDNMDRNFENVLKLNCPTKVPLINLTAVCNDLTPLAFDNQYFRDIISGRGLFVIDSGIAIDPRTAPFVRRFAVDQNYFFLVFTSAFVKLSSTNVLSGEMGEIRRDCSRVN